MAVLEKIKCWFELVRLGMVRFGLRQHSSKAIVKVSSRSDLLCCFSEDLVLVWFGLRQYPSEASVTVSLRSDLFWLFYRRFSVGLA